MKASLALFRCGRCRRSYSNPLGHVCVTRLDLPVRTGKTTLAPKVSVTGKCQDCGKPRGNPFTHVCGPKSDFKRRLAASKRRKKSRRPATAKHLYQSCQDKDCKRLACIAFREGRDEGYAEGSASGYESGYTAAAAAAGDGS